MNDGVVFPLHHQGQLPQEVDLIVVELACSPFDGLACVGVEILGRQLADYCGVVISDADGAVEFADCLQTLLGFCAIPHDVADLYPLIDVGILQLSDDRLQSVEVAVNVAENSYAHFRSGAGAGYVREKTKGHRA